jgi:hypothetical protein
LNNEEATLEPIVAIKIKYLGAININSFVKIIKKSMSTKNEENEETINFRNTA